MVTKATIVSKSMKLVSCLVAKYFHMWPISLRIYGLPEEKNETWEDTESKVREYIGRDLEMNEANSSIERTYNSGIGESPTSDS